LSESIPWTVRSLPIVGIRASADITPESAFDPKHPYHDPKAKRDTPKWVVVHVVFRRKFKKQVTLTDLKLHGQPGKPLENLQTLKQSRLSVSSVTPAQWRYILKLAGEDLESQ
jgi:predicted RNA-binding protein with PUA-like domain